MTDLKACFRIIIINLGFMLFAGFIMFFSFKFDAGVGIKIFFGIVSFILYIFLILVVVIFIVGRPKKLIIGCIYKFRHCFKTENGYYLVAPDNEIYFAPLIFIAGSVDVVELLSSGNNIRVVGKYGNSVYIKEA